MLCPFCKKNKLKEPLVRNPLSRTDNETYICEDCGTAEAMADYYASLEAQKIKEAYEEEE